MEYEFSVGSFFVGLIIIAVGVLFIRFHQWVADNFGHGVASYDRYKLYALLTCILGVIVSINLHATFFNWVFSLIFGR